MAFITQKQTLLACTSEGERGLGSVRQTIRNEEHALAYYLNNQQDSLSQNIKQHLKLRTPKQNKQQSDKHQKGLISQWEEKLLHGQYRKIICENPVSYTHLTLPTIYSV